MNLTQDQIKAKLIFPEINEIPEEVIELFESQKIKIREFTSDQKDILKGYIDYLYDSPKAQEIFNQITEPISIVPTSGFFGGKDFGSFEYPFVLFDINIFNERKYGFISKNGEYVEYDPKLAFMHELIHAITGKFDGDYVDNTVEPPRIVRKFTSPEDSLGPTQVIANKIHDELDAPIRVSYDGAALLYEPGESEVLGGIERGTQF